MFRHLSCMPKQTSQAQWASVLTVREQEVLALSDRGCSNKEIARELQISPSTVKNHIHNILQKLNVERRGQAAARGREDRYS
jgi:DNA-binding NarL/FixJ family response regulator